MAVSRRRFLELFAAASALAAFGKGAVVGDAFAAEVGGATNWVKSVCPLVRKSGKFERA